MTSTRVPDEHRKSARKHPDYAQQLEKAQAAARAIREFLAWMEEQEPAGPDAVWVMSAADTPLRAFCVEE